MKTALALSALIGLFAGGALAQDEAPANTFTITRPDESEAESELTIGACTNLLDEAGEPTTEQTSIFIIEATAFLVCRVYSSNDCAGLANYVGTGADTTTGLGYEPPATLGSYQCEMRQDGEVGGEGPDGEVVTEDAAAGDAATADAEGDEALVGRKRYVYW